ncbi:hypothetical protein WR25_14300 [Diploscapter pachys]|uniref:RRM domain-containing protein n=1 Tax=Diploscapter pachys TaxID=2018661 RepID=A0A2A2KH86_9BILA|nr:hypothetical protein WR25_14300 [Diploscapter pachys]
MGHYHRGPSARINEEDVPESRHTIFIRGLPGHITTDEIKDFFEDKIGGVSFDFVKQTPDQTRIFVAVRFESREKAKEAMDRFCEDDILGTRCELSWFRDIRRYVQYVSTQNGGGRGMAQRYRRGGFRGRGGYMRDSYREREPRRPRSRSYSTRSRTRSRSRSRASSRSRSRSSSSERPFSPVRRSHLSSEESSRRPSRASRRDSSVEVEKKKKKKAKKEKKRRSPSMRSRSSSISISEGSHSPLNLKTSGAESISPMMDSPTDMKPPSKKYKQHAKEEADGPIKINIPKTIPDIPTAPPETPVSLISNTSISFGLESDVPPKVYPKGQAQESVLPPPPLPPSLAKGEPESILCVGTTRGFRPITEPLKEPPVKKEKLSEIATISPKASFSYSPALEESTIQKPDPIVQVRVSNSNISNGTITPKRDFSDMTQPTSEAGRMFQDLSTFQTRLIQGIRAEQQEDTGSFSGLKLSALSSDVEDPEARKKALEVKLSALDDFETEKFLVQKKKWETAFKNDCQTFAFVAKKLVSKDGALEKSIRLSLIENFEDMEKQLMDKIEKYLESK